MWPDYIPQLREDQKISVFSGRATKSEGGVKPLEPLVINNVFSSEEKMGEKKWKKIDSGWTTEKNTF